MGLDAVATIGQDDALLARGQAGDPRVVFARVDDRVVFELDERL